MDRHRARLADFDAVPAGLLHRLEELGELLPEAFIGGRHLCERIYERSLAALVLGLLLDALKRLPGEAVGGNFLLYPLVELTQPAGGRLTELASDLVGRLRADAAGKGGDQ